MTSKILIWDNDGTIMSSRNPNDASSNAKVILPNVKRIMNSNNVLNIVCSGMKTPESESQNFDPIKVIERFRLLMDELPITIATFSPAIGGTECYVVIKRSPTDALEIRKAHEDVRYQHLIGKFKKPDTGMLIVIQDLIKEIGYESISTELLFVGDAWQDEQAATACDITFIPAQLIHALPEDAGIDEWQSQHALGKLVNTWQAYLDTVHDWQQLIHGIEPRKSGCGLVYELPNPIERPNENFALVDMCKLHFTEPHYHRETEVYFALQGHGIVVVGGKEHHIEKGSPIVIPPYIAHFVIPQEDLVLAVVNTPPFRPESYRVLSVQDPITRFDELQFKRLVEQKQD